MLGCQPLGPPPWPASKALSKLQEIGLPMDGELQQGDLGRLRAKVGGVVLARDLGLGAEVLRRDGRVIHVSRTNLVPFSRKL